MSEPLDSGAAARALYGDDAPSAAPSPQVAHPADKMWPVVGAPPVEPGEAFVEPLSQPNSDDLRAAFDRHVGALGLDPASAERLYGQMSPAILAAARGSHQDVVDGWADRSRAEFGDGLDEALSFAGRALEAHEGGAELLELLDGSGLSSHPAVLRFLNSVAKERPR